MIAVDYEEHQQGVFMRLGAYQFAVTGNLQNNLEKIKSAISKAASERVKLLIFPECALTGYPPHDISSSDRINVDEVNSAIEDMQKIAASKDMYIVIGTITMNKGKYYNSAIVLRPYQDRVIYNKRALWGWDRENFYAGNNTGVFKIADMKIGIRICFEVRFPEYFRELYRANTDLNIILFYDMSYRDDVERYELIQSHIRTRAVENVCPILTVNTNKPFQTAPTALYDKSGNALVELERNQEALLIYDFVKTTFSFGEQGRKEISDLLINQSLGTKLS